MSIKHHLGKRGQELKVGQEKSGLQNIPWSDLLRITKVD
jgi:hypothetical protein